VGLLSGNHQKNGADAMRQTITHLSVLIVRRKIFWLGGLLLLMIALPALAAGGGPYELTWDTLGGGRGSSRSGPYTLTGTIGQPDAWPPLSGGGYTIAGGFWPEFGGDGSSPKIYLPIILSGFTPS
jgi:hypothetical protein